jgi:sensor histidine kinase regulating citrate/malate metabolism
MRNKLHVTIILFVILSVLVFLPACSKKTTETEESDVTMQEEDLEAQQVRVRELLEKERQEHEAKARQFEKIKFMYEDIYFEKGSYKLSPVSR